MDTVKHQPLDLQLNEELGALKRLRERIKELGYAIDYLDRKITLYYAVDFSEIFSYLHHTEEEDRNIIGVTLDPQDRETSFLQYRLGLTHLFNSFAKTLYVLPSHTVEMWTYARTQGQKKLADGDQGLQLLERTRSLNPDLTTLLASVKDATQSEAASQELLTFVKSSEFGPLCVDVSEFVKSYKRGNVLRNLLSGGQISTRIDHLLSKHKIAATELKEPSEKEISPVFKRFPKLTKDLKPLSTRIDARAFLFLRNINRLLDKANARLILITRDIHLLEIAQSLSEDPSFEWSEARQCLRGIESVFLDLTLTGSASTESKRQWILESEMKLASMQESISRTLSRMKAEDSHSQASGLATVGNRLLKETAQLWNEQINVKLSLASAFIPWLERTFLEISSGENLPETFRNFRVEYQTLTNLLEYFSTPVYRTVAGQDVKAIWNTIEMDCLRMGFLNVLGEEGAERLTQVLTQTLTTSSGDSKTILYSKRFFKLPELQLVSETYRKRLKSLATDNAQQYEKSFILIIKEVVTGFNEPEDFLIMAFLLGLLDEWQQALEMVEKCRRVVADLPESSIQPPIIPSEIDYLSSAIKHRLAQTVVDPERAIALLIEAYDDIVRAKNALPDEPRYLVAEAGTAMLYHEKIKTLRLEPASPEISSLIEGQPEILSEGEAIEQTKRALSLLTSSDVRLRIVILNNLAFAEVLSDHPSLDEADEYLRQADEVIDNTSGKQALLLSAVLPHIDETKLMLRARYAVDEKNMAVLEESIHKLQTMAEETDLIEYEKRGFISHIQIINGWIRTVVNAVDIDAGREQL